MRIRFSRRTNQGLTLVETILVVCVVGGLAVMLLPALVGGHNHRHYNYCTNNLKQVALAFKVWAGDNNDRLPMEISVTNGGAMEAAAAGDGLKVFQVMSNELSTAKVLICQDDLLRRFAATNFTDDLTNKISYFAGADATANSTQMFLAGDDDFLYNQSPVRPGLISVTSPTQLEWNADRHGSITDQGWFKKTKRPGSGNIALTDGSVQSCFNSGLTNYLGQTGLATNRLAIP